MFKKKQTKTAIESLEMTFEGDISELNTLEVVPTVETKVEFLNKQIYELQEYDGGSLGKLIEKERYSSDDKFKIEFKLSIEVEG